MCNIAPLLGPIKTPFEGGTPVLPDFALAAKDLPAIYG